MVQHIFKGSCVMMAWAKYAKYRINIPKPKAFVIFQPLKCIITMIQTNITISIKMDIVMPLVLIYILK